MRVDELVTRSLVTVGHGLDNFNLSVAVTDAFIGHDGSRCLHSSGIGTQVECRSAEWGAISPR